MRRILNSLRGFTSVRPENLVGHIDFVTDVEIRGWACNKLDMSKPVRVEVLIDGNVIATVLADQYREDLKLAGIGTGCHGFALTLSKPASNGVALSARVKGALFPLFDDTPEWYRTHFALHNSRSRGIPSLRVGASSVTVGPLDEKIASEMQALWRAAHLRLSQDDHGRPRNMWTDLINFGHTELIQLLEGNDAAALARYCVEVQTKDFSHGLMQGREAFNDFRAASENGLQHALVAFQDALVSLAVFLGLFREECPEQGPLGELIRLPQEAVRQKIESHLGHSILPPPIFNGLYGLAFDDGVLHARDIQGLYLALRAINISGVEHPSLCEIGGGFGRAAYFAMLQGARQYTIVDLPTVALMQYFTLRRCLPETRITLAAPNPISHENQGINIVFANEFAACKGPFDVVINCDSFPEMGETICGDYLRAIASKTARLLSINQEANEPLTTGFGAVQCVVAELALSQNYRRLQRSRCWVRRGYVDEVFAVPIGN